MREILTPATRWMNLWDMTCSRKQPKIHPVFSEESNSKTEQGEGGSWCSMGTVSVWREGTVQETQWGWLHMTEMHLLPFNCHPENGSRGSFGTRFQRGGEVDQGNAFRLHPE